MVMFRRCFIAKAVNGKWYLQLGNFEYASESEDCTFYGPFDTQKEAEEELVNNHVDPGSVLLDDSGVLSVPKDAVMTKDLRKKWQ